VSYTSTLKRKEEVFSSLVLTLEPERRCMDVLYNFITAQTINILFMYMNTCPALDSCDAFMGDMGMYEKP